MKKLLLLVGTFFAVNSLLAMEPRLTVFTAKDFGVDISDRQAVIDFYWQRKYSLDDMFARAKRDAFDRSEGEAKQLFNTIIKKAERLSDGSESDLNGDKFARIVESFINEIVVYRDKFYPEQEDPIVRSKRINRYRNEEIYLKSRYDYFLTTDLVWSTEQKITEVQTVLEKARFLSSDSQRELREVELAHNLIPFIRTLESKLGELQSELVPEKNSRREKRSLEQESNPLKRLRFE